LTSALRKWIWNCFDEFLAFFPELRYSPSSPNEEVAFMRMIFTDTANQVEATSTPVFVLLVARCAPAPWGLDVFAGAPER
jgi:hypothetical protein